MPARAPKHADSGVVSSQPGGRFGLSGPYGLYRDNTALRVILIALLVSDSMLALFGLITGQLIRPGISEGASIRVDDILDATGSARMATGLLAVIAFCIWVNRSCKNAWLLDAPKMRTTPAWAVGSYFIPLICLWKPYVSMREIRDASFGGSDQLSTLLPVWWLCLLAFVLLICSNPLLTHADSDQQALIVASKLGVVATIVNIVLNYLTITLVAALSLAQNRRLPGYST